MATFPAIIMFLRHKELPHPFVPAINSFWYLICNKIFGYCKRPEELAILISVSRLLLRMCGLFIHHYFGPLLRMARVWSTSHSFTCYSPLWGFGRDRLEMGFQVHCGTVLGDLFSTGRQICPPKQSHNSLSQPSRPGLPRNLKVTNLIAHILIFYHMEHSQSLLLHNL